MDVDDEYDPYNYDDDYDDELDFTSPSGTNPDTMNMGALGAFLPDVTEMIDSTSEHLRPRPSSPMEEEEEKSAAAAAAAAPDPPRQLMYIRHDSPDRLTRLLAKLERDTKDGLRPSIITGYEPLGPGTAYVARFEYSAADFSKIQRAALSLVENRVDVQRHMKKHVYNDDRGNYIVLVWVSSTALQILATHKLCDILAPQHGESQVEMDQIEWARAHGL